MPTLTVILQIHKISLFPQPVISVGKDTGITFLTFQVITKETTEIGSIRQDKKKKLQSPEKSTKTSNFGSTRQNRQRTYEAFYKTDTPYHSSIAVPRFIPKTTLPAFVITISSSKPSKTYQTQIASCKSTKCHTVATPSQSQKEAN